MEKIQVIKKISGHLMIIFKKRIPIKRTEGIQPIYTFNYKITKNNMTEIEQVISNQLCNYIRN